MSDDVKPRRRYDSSGRQDQAQRARAATLRAAHELFLDRGFAGTTIPAVAAAAGLSVQSVYKTFENKGGLLKAVFDVAMAGDDEPLTMLQREGLGRVRDEPDPYRKLALYGEFVATTAPRHAPVQLLARSAAAGDPDAAAVWEQLCAERLRGMTMFGTALAEAGQLRDGVGADDARDLLWTYNSPEMYELLVLNRGWSPERYGAWVAESLTVALLPARQTVV